MSSTINTGWLKDNNGEKFAPKTLASQVVTPEGISFEEKIQAQLENIDSASDVELTKAEYDALGDIVLTDGKTYFITDIDGGNGGSGGTIIANTVKELTQKVDQCFQSVSNGKSLIASAITDKKVPTDADATFAEMEANIRAIKGGSGTAQKAHVLAPYTFTNNDGVEYTGEMANQGAKTSSLNCGASYTIPAGYHNGSGKITANSLASQTSATAAAADIASGKTAYVNGGKITGTGYTLGNPSVVAKRYTDTSAAFTANVTNGKKYILLADGAFSRGPGTTSPTLSGVTGFSYSKITTVTSGNCGYAIFLITATSSSISVAGSGHHLYWTLIAI